MWDRCWSTAVVRLGLTTEQFFRLTPRQLRVLADRDHEFLEMQREHSELLAGIITANTVNYSFYHPKQAKAPADFMPSRMGKSRAAPKALIAQNIRCFLQAQTKLRNKNANGKS